MVVRIERTFISLFGGIGGFDLAFQRQGWKCVYYNDWDKYAVQTYNKNFNTSYEPSDITKLDANTIPDHALLCAGFPCQSFSLAGKRKGFKDTRGTMFFEICRIIKAKRTPVLLLENVKGLLSHDEGKTFFTILKCLDELGYDAEWQVLNSKHFSVPQNRERVFIIANLRGTSRLKIFPIAGAGSTIDSRYGQRWSSETHVLCGSPRTGNQKKGGTGLLFSKKHCFTLDNTRTHKVLSIVQQLNQPKHAGDRFYGVEGVSPCIMARARANQYASPKILDVYNKKIQDDCCALTEPHHNNIRVVGGGSIRRLTPLECERLQGFPDGWTEGVSDAQRYKQLGNAVTVNVIEAIAKRLNESV